MPGRVLDARHRRPVAAGCIATLRQPDEDLWIRNSDETTRIAGDLLATWRKMARHRNNSEIRSGGVVRFRVSETVDLNALAQADSMNSKEIARMRCWRF